MKPWPIIVNTKGRSDSKLLHALAARPDLDVTIVVEPQEFIDYRGVLPSLRCSVLDEDNRGLFYSRNRALDLADERDLDWFWLLDDDIQRFTRVIDKKTHACPIDEALMAAQDAALAMPNIGQVSLEYEQFAWSCGGRVKMNSYADNVVGFNAAALRARAIRFREPFISLGIKGDRDITAQILAAGLDTARITSHAFKTPRDGSNKGGLHDLYARAGRERAGSEALARMWPWCCSVVVKPNGREDAKMEWARVRRG